MGPSNANTSFLVDSNGTTLATSAPVPQATG